MKDIQDTHFVQIALSKLDANEGQLAGLPTNPRQITESKMEKLKRNISDYPEMLTLRGLLVYPMKTGRYIIIGGNMRYHAMKSLGMKEAPCVIIPADTPVENLKAYTILDNNGFGQYDWDSLANEWDNDQLLSWGTDLPMFDTSQQEEADSFIEETESKQDEQEQEKEDYVKDDKTEAMISQAVRCAAGEIADQYDALQGFSFITPHTAKIDFIKFCHYGKEYPRYDSLAFHSQQFHTNGDSRSVYDGLRSIAAGGIKAERLRFVTQDKLSQMIKVSLAFNGSRMPLDFPASLAKTLINEFCPADGAVLDPCSGWGGRLIGFLASHAYSYTGVDASPYQVEGDLKIFDTFKDAAQGEKIAQITCSPFEKYDAGEEEFDFALTSPPYFDTEKYLGGEQSHSTSDNYEQWRDTFYTQLIQKVYTALKMGSVFALQIGSQSYPLLEDGKRIALQIGFSCIEVRPTDMTNNFNQTEEYKGEVVMILRKS